MPPTKPLAPTAKIIADAFPVRTVVDKNGRRITWKRLTILERARFLRAVGADNSGNTEFLMIGMIAAMIQDIDGTPNPTPKTLQQIDAAIDRMGDPGYEAISDDLVVLAGEMADSSVETDAKNS